MYGKVFCLQPIPSEWPLKRWPCQVIPSTAAYSRLRLQAILTSTLHKKLYLQRLHFLLLTLCISYTLPMTNLDVNLSTCTCATSRTSAAMSNFIYLNELLTIIRHLGRPSCQYPLVGNQPWQHVCDAAVRGPVGPRSDRLNFAASE